MAHALRKYREDNALTLDDAAVALKVTAATLSRIETGKNTPSAELMRRIDEWTVGTVTPNDLVRIEPTPIEDDFVPDLPEYDGRHDA